MSEAEQRYGLRIQEIESKLKALSEQVSGELSEEISELREGNMHFAWMKSDLQRVLEDFRNRELGGEVDDFVADLFGGEGGEDAAEELDEIQFINIGKKEEPGTAFKAHWIYVSDSTSYSSCDQVTSKDIAETVFLEASQKKISEGVEISNGDLLFLMCRPAIPASDSEVTEETQICTYIGLYLDTAGDQDQEPASETEVLITETLTTGEDEGVTAVASVFVWEECTCSSSSDEDGKVNIPTVSTGSPASTGNFVVSSTSSSSSSNTNIVGLGNHTVTPKVCLLSNPNTVSGSSSSLTLKPVDDVTLTSSSIDLFANKCGELDKDDSSSSTSTSTVLQLGSGSTNQFNVLDGLSAGTAVSLGGSNIRAFIPLVSLGNASDVDSVVESVAFAPNEAGIPIEKSTTTETGSPLDKNTYVLNLATQNHYSGITTQQSPTEYEITAHEINNNAKNADFSWLSNYDVTLDSYYESIDSSAQTGDAVHRIYKTETKRKNVSWIEGILTDTGSEVSKSKTLVGVIRVPGDKITYKCDDYGGCVPDPSGEYEESTCGGYCETADCPLDYRPSTYYVYAYNASRECWELQSEHIIDESNPLNDASNQYYSNSGRLTKDCSGSEDVTKFYVNNVEVVNNDTSKYVETPLPEEQVCPEIVTPLYTHSESNATSSLGSTPFTHTIVLDEATTEAADITVNFRTGVVVDTLKIEGVGSMGGTATILDTSVNPEAGDYIAGDSTASDWNSRIFQITLPIDTKEIKITIDHTQANLGFYSGTGWNFALYTKNENVDAAISAAWSPLQDRPDRIKWRVRSDCASVSVFNDCAGNTPCEQFELSDNVVQDGMPGVDYFDTECECADADCP